MAQPERPAVTLGKVPPGVLSIGWIRTVCLCLAIAVSASTRAADFRFDSMREVIETRGIKSVDELVQALPPDLRAHYTLVFASRSLQGASPAYPRAILFDSDAEFIVTFNGDPAERGNSVVETMEFDPRHNNFLFREIQFPADRSGAVSISEANSARCVACHGQPARPVWDAAPFWPGAYGERYGAGLSAAESKGMHEFLALQPGHARYRNLLGAAALAERTTYVASAREVYNGVKTTSPNAQLSALLTRLNIRSIISEMTSRPAFATHRYVLLAAAEGNCGALPEYYPESMREEIAEQLRAYRRTSAATGRLQAEAVTTRLAGANGRYQRSAAGLDELRFVVERSLGLATQQWTLALERNTYDASAPEGAPTLAQVLFEWVAVTDEELRGLHAYRSFTSGDRYCEHLRRQSVRALEAWYPAQPWVQASTRAVQVTATVNGDPDASSSQDPSSWKPEFLDRCTACHTGEVAPFIPFADADALANRLATGNYPHGRLLDEILYRLAPEAGSKSMPRGITISAEQRRRLEEYFLGLGPRGAMPGAFQATASPR